MWLDTIFAPFVTERPICVMARAALERLLDAQRIDDLCARTAQQQYTRERMFASLVQWMSAGVLGVHPPVHAAYQANSAAIGVSPTALYTKLARLATGVSAALVRHSATLAEPVGKALRASHPRWVSGSQSKGRDGTHLSSPEHRLKDLRGTWAAPWPGQAQGVWEQPRLWSTDVMLREEGHAQERSVMPAVLPCVEADPLWSEERHFGTLGLLFGMYRRGAAFGVRQHGQLPGEWLGRAKRPGTTRSGPVYAQARQGQDPATGETRRLRRMTLKLQVATRDGDTERHMLSTVPRGRGAATHLARVYGKRWGIETAFFAITPTLACEINTLGDPKAALFAFCLALLAYNAVSLRKATLRSAHGRQQMNDEVAGYYGSLEIGRPYDGMMMAMPAPPWQCFRDLSDRACADALREWASSVKLSSYQKHPRGPKKKPLERTPYEHGKHVSTAKLLANR